VINSRCVSDTKTKTN